MSESKETLAILLGCKKFPKIIFFVVLHFCLKVYNLILSIFFVVVNPSEKKIPNILTKLILSSRLIPSTSSATRCQTLTPATTRPSTRAAMVTSWRASTRCTSPMAPSAMLTTMGTSTLGKLIWLLEDGFSVIYKLRRSRYRKEQIRY